MYPLLLISGVLINFVIANDWNITHHEDEHRLARVENLTKMRFALWKQHLWKPHKRTNKTSYFDRAENMIRLPIMTNVDKKKKILKKSPKRTIQKIIKKNRQKTKKIYVVMMTTSMSPETYDQGMDEMTAKKEVVTTEQPNLKKKAKKYNTKLTRYPKPFQKLQKKKYEPYHKNQYHKRIRRNIFDNDDIFYVIKDFDENKFLEGEY